MFAQPERPDTELDEAISHVYSNMAFETPGSEEYSKMLDALTRLYSLRKNPTPAQVSPDTAATILGHLLGILIIVRHEEMHVITSKALTFVTKLR